MNIGEAKVANIIFNFTGKVSSAFSEKIDYEKDDYCLYKNNLYRFITPKPSGAWNGNAVKMVTVLSELKEYILSLYPIGSIYMSMLSDNPSDLFGGIWESINDRFLLSSGDTYVAGDTGGEASHTLTTSEMPYHTHTYAVYECNRNVNGKAGTGGQSPNSLSSTGSTSSSGGNASHNNMPPYLVVYMWERIA